MTGDFQKIVKDKSIYSHNKKKENNLDYYIAKNISNDNWWQNERDKDSSLNDPADSKKKIFLEKDLKATKVIPYKMEKVEETPDNLGYFDSRFGTISIGYNKYKKNSDIAFSLIPEKMKREERIPSLKPNNVNTYFGGEMKKKRRTFKASKLSFIYDRSNEEIKKIMDDKDGIFNKEENLLYTDKTEDKHIEELKKLNNWSLPENRYNTSKQVSEIREIKREKEKDNSEFLKEIREFIHQIKYGKLKKIIESDEAISRSKRMSDSSVTSTSIELMMLRRMIKKLIEELSEKIDLKEFNNIDIDRANEVQLKATLKKLKDKIG